MTEFSHPLHDRGAIGLLAGMGVRSTGPFLDLVIDECRRQYGARHEADFPPMIVFSWPTPYRFDQPLDDDAMLESLVAGLQWLESTGVAFIAMPCNTAHIYFEELEGAVDIPLLDMVVSAIDAMPEGTKRVALLATRATRDAELYQGVLEDNELETIASDETQDKLDTLLTGIHNGDDIAGLRRDWLAVLEGVTAEGAEAGLIACTDLNALFDDPSQGPLPLVDGTRALAAEVVDYWRSLEEEPYDDEDNVVLGW